MQLAVGALGGMLANWALDPSAQRRFGWHPQNPARSAKAVAMSTAAASGIPFAASALLPSTSSTIPGRYKSRDALSIQIVSHASCWMIEELDYAYLWL